MIVKLLTEHHLECLSLKGGCRGSSKSTYVKMSHCWKSHALAQIIIQFKHISSWIFTMYIYFSVCIVTRFVYYRKYKNVIILCIDHKKNNNPGTCG